MPIDTQTVGKPPAAETGDERLERIEKTLGAVAAAIAELAKRPTSMSMAVDPEKRVADMVRRDGDVARQRMVRDLVNPRSQAAGFQPDDVVMLIDVGDSERASQIRKAKGLPPEDPVLGVIRNYMYTKRNGIRKYKVWIKGVGEDGISEDELELCLT